MGPPGLGNRRLIRLGCPYFKRRYAAVEHRPHGGWPERKERGRASWETSRSSERREPSSESDPFANESGRNRTFNLCIKSPLLCRLRYAPVSVSRRRRRCVSGTRVTVKPHGVADRTRTGNTSSHSPVLHH